MPSTYTTNLGIELPADGELDGVWGDVVNENMDILDRAINGVLSLSLSGTSSTLTTSSGTHTITISPNDAEKIYFVQNNTAQTVAFNQGSGGNASIFAGDSAIVYADGAGAAGAVVNLTNQFGMSSVNITGGSITGLADLSLSAANPSITFLETDTTDTDAKIRLNAGTLIFETVTDAGAQVRSNIRIASNGNVGVGTTSDASTLLEVSSDTNPTAAFIAYISGTTMTVTGITSGALAVGDRVFGAGVEWNTVITAQLTGTTGASGTYSVNNSQTVSTAPTGIAMDSSNAGKSVLRLTNTDTTEAAGQTTGGVEFYGSDASTPGAGVKGYVAVIAEDSTPDSAMIFGTSNDTASNLAVERMRIDSLGNVGIGTKSPVSPLHVYLTDATTYGDGTGALDTTNLIRVQNDSEVNDTYSGIQLVSENAVGTQGWWSIASVSTSSNYDNHLVFNTRTGADTYAERMRIDNAGNVGINKAVPVDTLDVVGTIAATGAFTRTGADSTASATMLQAFRAGNGVQTGGACRIRSFGDGTGDAVTMVFDTNSQDAMRIDGSQIVMIGTTDTSPTANNVAGVAMNAGTFSANADATFHRIGRRQDGTVVSFYSAGDAEGSISISGTTTSYNGGHLSRWSQTADNTRIVGLLKGTVLTNLDQMAVWASQANEQLNCMAVSTVEGDPNVAGVFVNWDDDDEVFTADMNVAMTGDMVIRIAAGTTVQRGDLLMSAGDGTAKPQGDDIVRSKTIAKVTSTHISETYADGSYVVPCVLMAC
jgi:hypothetical protein